MDLIKIDEEVEKWSRQSDSFKKLFESSQTTDCAFMIEGQEIKAHKLLLKHNSPVFEQMFYGKFAQDLIIINDNYVSADNFRKILQFIYTEIIEFDTVIDAWDLFYICNKYLLNDLKLECLKYIDNNKSISTLALSYEYAEMYDLKEIQMKFLNEMCIYIRGLLPTTIEHYYHMKVTTLVTLLEQKCLNVNSQELIEIICIWASNELDNRDIDITIENVVCLLENLDLMPFVNCLNNEQHFYQLNRHSFARKCSAYLKNLQINQPKIYKTYQYTNWALFCRMRMMYKIADRIELQRFNPLISKIIVNKPLVLYGLLVSTIDYYDCDYTIDVRIQIIDTKGKSLNLTRFTKRISYENCIYVPLDEICTLKNDRIYTIKIDYTNRDDLDGTSTVLCHYMEHDLIDNKTKICISFIENMGSVIRGICYYPL